MKENEEIAVHTPSEDTIEATHPTHPTQIQQLQHQQITKRICTIYCWDNL
jgi:hypothetical protein